MSKKKRFNIRSRQDALKKQQDRDFTKVSQNLNSELNEVNVEALLEEQVLIEDEEDSSDSQVKDHTLNSRSKNPATPYVIKPIYILDTNVIIGCVDLIYDPDDEDWREPLDFKPNLDHAHIVVPTIVLEELNHLKNESSYRGMIARIAIKRLERFFANSGRKISEILSLDRPIPTGFKDQVISLLPLQHNFSKLLPYTPTKDDNDGWIAVTALAATMLAEGLNIDDTEVSDILKRSSRSKNVTLLTNDSNLRSKADLYAVKTANYSFKKPAPFTGLRTVIASFELFNRFVGYEGQSNGISLADWEAYLPDEAPLRANEYFEMNLENDEDFPSMYFADGVSFKNVGRFNKESGRIYPLRFFKNEGVMPQNAGIAAYYDALNDDRIQVVTVTGPAGTGKTYSAIMHAVKSVQAGKYSRAIVISSSSAKNPLGALPGNFDQKMEPFISSCKDAIRSYLSKTPEFRQKRKLLGRFGDTNTVSEKANPKEKPSFKRGQKNANWDYYNSLISDDEEYDCYSANDFPEKHSRKKSKTFYENAEPKNKTTPSEGIKTSYSEQLDKQVDYIFNRYFTSMPYELAQGHSFDDSIIILDEFQRIEIDEADTLITRPGQNSKLIVCGDINQIHNSSLEKRFKNGLVYTKLLFDDEEIAAHINLTESLRSDITHIMTKNREKIRHMMAQL